MSVLYRFKILSAEGEDSIIKSYEFPFLNEKTNSSRFETLFLELRNSSVENRFFQETPEFSVDKFNDRNIH